MNPAHLSVSLSRLFSPGAVVAVLHEAADPDLLLPDEAASMGRAVPTRLREFTAGRLCARRALAEFGVFDFPIRPAEDRQPVWPDSMAGSITHTDGFCAAVVAERRRIRALGVDSEVTGGVKVEIWSRICLPAELAWVRSLPESERGAAVTLIFSAKEAFYKCQYSVVRERLGFHDVSVEAGAWEGSDGVFRIHPARALAIAEHAPLPLQGRYLFHETWLTAGVDLAPAAAPMPAQ
jgi:4'-phosphopantetheinyl transferase EntD